MAGDFAIKPSDQVAMDDYAARIANQEAFARAQPTPPKPDPVPVLYKQEAAPDANAFGAADVKAIENADIGDEAALRKLGKEVEANELRDTRAARMADIRAQLGIPAPRAPDPRAKVLAEIGRVPAGAKPSDYKAPDLSQAPWLQGDARTRVSNAMVEIAAANELSAETASWISHAILQHAAALKPMTEPTERQAYLAKQDAMIERMAGGYIKAREMKETARVFLNRSSLGREVMDPHLRNAELVLTINNIENVRKQFEASKGK